jgi:hypothetical protein
MPLDFSHGFIVAAEVFAEELLRNGVEMQAVLRQCEAVPFVLANQRTPQ